ncbi:MAG: hypothetical protein WBO10_01915 [Pyrinomonadaceae bacterium]
MKASEVITLFQSQIDDLQRKAKASARDQIQFHIALEERQRQSKKLIDIMIKGGDRDLTGIEIVELSLTKEDNNKLMEEELIASHHTNS